MSPCRLRYKRLKDSSVQVPVLTRNELLVRRNGQTSILIACMMLTEDAVSDRHPSESIM